MVDKAKAKPDNRPHHAPSVSGEGWYVIHQGSEIKVEHHKTTPNTKHEPGEKMIRASGPYADKSIADLVVERMRGKFQRRPIRRKAVK